MKMFSNWDQKTLYDVIAKIPGSTEPEEWVIRGNHHDAWVNGAEDPISGMSAELEEARSLGELVKGRLEAASHHRLLRMGWRGTGITRFRPSGSRHMWMSCGNMR